MDPSNAFLFGNFSGLILGLILFYVIYKVGRHIARKTIREVFENYGVRNGLDYYRRMSETCTDEEGRRLLEEEMGRYLADSQAHEDRLDEIAQQYLPRE